MLTRKYGEQLQKSGLTINDFAGIDPSPNKKYLQWLVRTYINQPYDLRDKRITQFLSSPDLGDLMQKYTTMETFLEDHMKAFEKQFRAKDLTTINHDGNKSMMVQRNNEDVKFLLLKGSKLIGMFNLDFTHERQGFASVHAHINTGYRQKGYGTYAYDCIEKYIHDEWGLKLGASSLLSTNAVAFWLKRNPEAMAHSRNTGITF